MLLLLLIIEPVVCQAQLSYRGFSGGWAVDGGWANGPLIIPSMVDGLPVVAIWHHAFDYCTGMTSVTIPKTVTGIGSSAFEGCTGLTALTIPEGVRGIEPSVFKGCTGLTSLVIPDNVTQINQDAFAWCTGLTNVLIGKGVNNLSTTAFRYTSKLLGFTVDPLNPAYSSVAGVLFNQDRTSLCQYPAGRAGSYGVPSSVTTINFSAFSSCSLLTHITLPPGVTNLAFGAFVGCMGLRSVTIPSSVGWIGNYAFGSCHGLRSVYFLGNAPIAGDGNDRDMFYDDANAVGYYLPGTTGWGATYGTLPMKPWTPAASGGTLDGLTGQFSFSIEGPSGLTVVMEACTNLALPVWLPVDTNTLVNESCRLTDPEPAHRCGRFYRVRWL